ncbi:MAG: hypothetical protein ABIQ95_01310 [Bdellovibrionia bacterium]
MKIKQKLVSYVVMGTLVALGATSVAMAEMNGGGANIGAFAGAGFHTGSIIGISSTNTELAGGVEANYRLPSNPIQVGAEFYSSRGNSQLMAKVDFYPAEEFFVGALAGISLGNGQNFLWGAEAGMLFDLGNGLQFGPKVEYVTGNTSSNALNASSYSISALGLLRYNFTASK